MKALRYLDGRLQMQEVPRSVASGREALVRVTLAGICNTDLEIVRGYANFQGTFGHEFVGIVEASPDPTQVGKRVVGEINAGCGTCEFCRRHDPRHCLNRTVLGIAGRDGAFAEYLTLPAENLYSVPAPVSDRAAVFTEPLAAACEILEQVQVDSSRRAAILGDGKLGQLIARVLKTTGCDLWLIGKHEEKLKVAAQAGIRTLLNRDLSVRQEERFDLVVEATGSPLGLDAALALTRPRGVLVLKSTFHGPAALDTSRIVVDEISLVGSRCGRFGPALALLKAGSVDVEPLISAEFPLAEGIAAMAEAGKRGVLKVLISPQAPSAPSGRG
jgi:threonine dehydrogenase-like Zn-dependent dehydrogenase